MREFANVIRRGPGTVYGPNVMAVSSITDRAAPAAKRRLPIQVANETKMIKATIELLEKHRVGEITSRMIAERSGTATNYITRYFHGRDGLLLAVASELSRRISILVRSEESIIEIDRPGNYVTRILSIPEVDMWFKVYRYLSGRNLTDVGRDGKPPLVTALEEAISLIFGVEGDYVPICANIFITYILGYGAFGPFIGATDDEAEQALATMATLVTLLVERERGASTA
jgi:AcrR family transcriptional regulator